LSKIAAIRKLKEQNIIANAKARADEKAIAKDETRARSAGFAAGVDVTMAKDNMKEAKKEKAALQKKEAAAKSLFDADAKIQSAKKKAKIAASKKAIDAALKFKD